MSLQDALKYYTDHVSSLLNEGFAPSGANGTIIEGKTSTSDSAYPNWWKVRLTAAHGYGTYEGTLDNVYEGWVAENYLESLGGGNTGAENPADVRGNDAYDFSLAYEKLRAATLSVGEVTKAEVEQSFKGLSSKEVTPCVGFFFSADTQYQTSRDRLLGESCSEFTGGSPDSDMQRYDIRIPDVAAGDYYILFVADYPNRFTETNETNNMLYLPIVVRNESPDGSAGTQTDTPEEAGDSAPPNSPVCGNGIIEAGEQCDGSDVDGASCLTQGYDYGNVLCTSSCRISTANCADVKMTFPVGAPVEVSNPGDVGANVHKCASKSSSQCPEITDTDYSGVAINGTAGTISASPVRDMAGYDYVWWKVDFGDYEGWVIENFLKPGTQKNDITLPADAKAPLISAIAPDILPLVEKSGALFDITLTGRNFTSASKVEWKTATGSRGFFPAAQTRYRNDGTIVIADVFTGSTAQWWQFRVVNGAVSSAWSGTVDTEEGRIEDPVTPDADDACPLPSAPLAAGTNHPDVLQIKRYLLTPDSALDHDFNGQTQAIFGQWQIANKVVNSKNNTNYGVYDLKTRSKMCERYFSVQRVTPILSDIIQDWTPQYLLEEAPIRQGLINLFSSKERLQQIHQDFANTQIDLRALALKQTTAAAELLEKGYIEDAYNLKNMAATNIFLADEFKKAAYAFWLEDPKQSCEVLYRVSKLFTDAAFHNVILKVLAMGEDSALDAEFKECNAKDSIATTVDHGSHMLLEHIAKIKLKKLGIDGEGPGKIIKAANILEDGYELFEAFDQKIDGRDHAEILNDLENELIGNIPASVRDAEDTKVYLGGKCTLVRETGPAGDGITTPLQKGSGAESQIVCAGLTCTLSQFADGYNIPVRPIAEKALLLAGQDTKETFSDIIGHWAEEYIETAHHLGLIEGKTKERAAPDDQITRAEALKITFLTMGIDVAGIPVESLACTFVDVREHEWYYKVIAAGEKMGFINNNKNNAYPNNAITRAETLKLLAIAKQVNIGVYYGRTGGFTDVQVDEWFAPYVAWAKQNGVANGYGGNTFQPNSPITRAEFIKIVIAAFDL